MNKLKIMKLEWKYLAPYLPYGLRGVANFLPTTPFIVKELKESFVKGETVEGNNVPLGCPMFDFKPIFRPWSDLTKVILTENKALVPLVELAKISFFKNSKHNLYKDYIVLGAGYSFHLYNNSDGVSFSCKRGYDGNKWEYDCFVPKQLELFQKLFEWHFNVFNLPEHLWIDINTL